CAARNNRFRPAGQDADRARRAELGERPAAAFRPAVKGLGVHVRRKPGSGRVTARPGDGAVLEREAAVIVGLSGE
ncbi:MAG: hypothetical protein BJ554DRAFT_2419, partial [Olpidium bornovanus]